MSKGRAPIAPAIALIRPMMVVSRARPAGVGPAVGFCALRSADADAPSSGHLWPYGGWIGIPDAALCSLLNGSHPRPVNAYLTSMVGCQGVRVPCRAGHGRRELILEGSRGHRLARWSAWQGGSPGKSWAGESPAPPATGSDSDRALLGAGGALRDGSAARRPDRRRRGVGLRGGPPACPAGHPLRRD
jgi:hypothetical protein